MSSTIIFSSRVEILTVLSSGEDAEIQSNDGASALRLNLIEGLIEKESRTPAGNDSISAPNADTVIKDDSKNIKVSRKNILIIIEYYIMNFKCLGLKDFFYDFKLYYDRTRASRIFEPWKHRDTEIF